MSSQVLKVLDVEWYKKTKHRVNISKLHISLILNDLLLQRFLFKLQKIKAEKTWHANACLTFGSWIMLLTCLQEPQLDRMCLSQFWIQQLFAALGAD